WKIFCPPARAQPWCCARTPTTASIASACASCDSPVIPTGLWPESRGGFRPRAWRNDGGLDFPGGVQARGDIDLAHRGDMRFADLAGHIARHESADLVIDAGQNAQQLAAPG